MNRTRTPMGLPYRACAVPLAFGLVLGPTLPATAAADSAGVLAAAVMDMHASACGAMQSDPLVQQAADNVNDSNDKWLNHASRSVPVPDALALLKDLGYQGNTATILLGAGKTAADATKGVLLQGYLSTRDCSYHLIGASTVHNDGKDLVLAAVVLAG